MSEFIINNTYELSRKLLALTENKPLVIVCVGTDLVGGDCLGPLVGQFLTESAVPAYVYGTLNSPVNALNVDRINSFVRLKHPCHTVVAVDSAVGEPYERGRIIVSGCPLSPGSAQDKKLAALGDVSITAVTSSFLPTQKGFALAGLGFVYSIAKDIVSLISRCLIKPHSGGLGDCLPSDHYFTPSGEFLQ